MVEMVGEKVEPIDLSNVKTKVEELPVNNLQRELDDTEAEDGTWVIILRPKKAQDGSHNM